MIVVPWLCFTLIKCMVAEFYESGCTRRATVTGSRGVHCCLHFRASFLLRLTFCEEIASFFTFSNLSTFTKNLLQPSLYTCALCNCMPLISYLSLTIFPNSYVLFVSNVLTKGCCL